MSNLIKTRYCLAMSRLISSLLAICFLFVSTVAQATSSSEHEHNADETPVAVAYEVVIDSKTTAVASQSDDCPCDSYLSKMASIVCGVTLAFDSHDTGLEGPAASSISLEWISDTVPGTINDKLKRPPRQIL